MVSTSAVPAPVTASLSSNLAVDQSQLVVAYSQARYALLTCPSTGISCYGSPVPDTLDLPSLFAAGTAFASTRVTEGFATAFEARAAGADTGTRFLVKYTGFPATRAPLHPRRRGRLGRSPTHLGRRPEPAAGRRPVPAR